MSKSKRGSAVQWYLPGKKRPFARSTKSESDCIVVLAEMGHTPRSALQADLILSLTEKAILQGFVDAGYGLTTLQELKVR